MRIHLRVLAATIALTMSGNVLAMGNDPPSTPKPAAAPSDYGRAKAMIEARNYKDAIPLLQQVVAKEPRNADAYNLLGYATRKSGNPNGSLQYYNQALQIDPKHLGAHEYVGEAYLMLDQPLRIGIGLHAGPAIVGEMGYDRAASLTAIGDTVNTASRLESLTKDFKVELVVSQELVDRAGVDLSAAPLHEVDIRGRQGTLAVRAIVRARDLTSLSS